MENKGNFPVDPKPEFFKVYMPRLCKDHMVLPVAFNSFLAKPLPKNVTVSSRSGNIWTMELRKAGCRVFLLNGWKKFIKDADLTGGEFLVFEYDGLQAFKVNIFHLSTCGTTRCSVQREGIKDDDEVGEEEEEEREEEGEEDDDDDDDHEEEVEEYADTDEEQAKDGNVDDIGDIERRETRGGLKMKNQKEKKSPCRRGGLYLKNGMGDHGKYLDNPMNPSFEVNPKSKRTSELQIPKVIIKDYDLRFPEFINFVDPIGELKRKIGTWKSKRVFVSGFNSVIRRNKVKQTDKVICEVVAEAKGLVRAIKIHIIRG